MPLVCLCPAIKLGLGAHIDPLEPAPLSFEVGQTSIIIRDLPPAIGGEFEVSSDTITFQEAE